MVEISNNNGTSSVCFISGDDEYSGVVKIAAQVRLDVERVTGALPSETDFQAEENVIPSDAEYAVIYGTAGKSSLISQLEEAGTISLADVKGKREVYSFTIKESPLPGIKAAVIIAGSDKRGTIYGLFHLSELMGVSPLVDWAGIMPLHQDSVKLTAEDDMVSKEPSVKFRGFFINDEWPAFGNWCNHNYGGFNASMYGHVFELLLRLKGNYMWPAMWSSRFSEDGPGLANAELADELGVIMGASHHEPCCRNGEEYKYLRGPGSIYGDAWNFRANKEGITKFWEDGLKRSGGFENVITVGMRGEADTAILGKNATLKDNIDLLRDVLKTQNSLIKQYVNPDVQQVPRMLALYKEVEPYFYGDKETKGLMGDPELDGVTLMLCDDNHGNLRTVPTEEMRSHKGGYGMYYHFDYHGSPFSYEWANTNHLPKVKEQMCAAWDSGIRELWIVNMGDIATNEFPLSYFLNLAYDYDRFSRLEYTTAEYTKEWTDFQFAPLPSEQRDQITEILNGYTKLAFLRRTECIRSDTYHPANFSEADKVLERAQAIIESAENLKATLEKDAEVPGSPAAAVYSGFYSQVFFPAAGTMNVLRLQITAGKNHWYARKGILAANTIPETTDSYIAYDRALVAELDKIDNGRWYAMGWSEHIGFTNWNEEEDQLPINMTIHSAAKPRLIVWLEGSDRTTSGLDWTRVTLKLDSFRNPECSSSVINIAAGSIIETPYKIECDKDWLSFSRTEGTVSGTNLIQKITVTINRELAAKDTDPVAGIRIFNDDRSAGRVSIPVVADARTPETAGLPAGTFVQTGSFISMEAEHFVKNEAADDASFKVLEDYGKNLSAIKAFPTERWFPDADKAPFVEYAFALEEGGSMTLSFHMNPSNPASKANKLQFMAEVNGTRILKDTVPASYAVGDNQYPWSDEVTNNIRISSITAECRKGLNTLRIYPVTPAFVLEKITISPEDKPVPASYLGAPETYRLK